MLGLNFSITKAISHTLKSLYPIKVFNDFHQYLDEEEYDSEVLRDDLKDEEPFFVEYIISKNPSTFNDAAQKQELTVNVKKLLHETQKKSAYGNVSDDSMSPEEEQEASMELIKQLKAQDEIKKQQNEEQIKKDEKYAQILANNRNDQQQNKYKNEWWSCIHCTFINNNNNNNNNKTINKICSMCNKTQQNNIEQKTDNFLVDEKWNCIYKELEGNYLNTNQCHKYYNTVIDIISKKGFEMDDAAEDLNEFAEINNESLIAEGIIEKFGWKQNDIHTLRLITCLKRAFAKNIDNIGNIGNIGNIAPIHNAEEDVLYQVNDNIDGDDHGGMNEIDSWKTKIATIISLRNDNKYNKKLAKYDLFAKALSIFGHRELCCLLRLIIREKMIKTQKEFNNGADIIRFIRNRFEEKAQEFDDKTFEKIFKIGFNEKLMAHNSILRKINQQYHVSIDIQLIQIWMIAIVMKMNQYFVKYKSCHSIFCLRFLPQNQLIFNNDINITLYQRIYRAFKLLEESEKEMVSDDCWIFVIDFSKLNNNNEPEIYFESRELFDDEIITERKYNNDYKQNQLYHLKKLDYLVCKENDNTAMALQLSFHKYWRNNCVSWLTHSSGHIPFIEQDITQFVPKLFKNSPHSISDDEWVEIVNKGKITEIKSMDRMYSELEQSYHNFMNGNDNQ